MLKRCWFLAYPTYTTKRLHTPFEKVMLNTGGSKMKFKLMMILTVIAFNAIIALNKVYNDVGADTTAKCMIAVIVPVVMIAIVKDFRKGNF